LIGSYSERKHKIVC